MIENAATSTRTISETKSPTVTARIARTTVISNVRPSASTLPPFVRVVPCVMS